MIRLILALLFLLLLPLSANGAPKDPGHPFVPSEQVEAKDLVPFPADWAQPKTSKDLEGILKDANRMGSVNSVSFSPDGRTLASGSSDNTIRLWDVSSGKERAKLEGHSNGVSSVAFSPDGRTLASGSGDRTVRLWDVSSGKERAKLEGHSNGVLSVTFSPDGRTLASGSDDNTIRLWDVSSGKERAKLEGHSNWVLSVTFSPDGRTLASGSGDRTVRLWDVSSGKERAKLEGHSGSVWSVSFSPDGRTLASGSDDNTIRLWDVSSGKERAKLEGHSGSVWSVSFSPDGRTLASGSGDRTVRLWDVSSGKERAKLEGHSNWVFSVTFSPDGRTLASGSSDNTIRLWDVSSGKECTKLEGHSEGVLSVTFSPDGRTLASGSSDNTIRLWDVMTGKERAKLEGHSEVVSSVSFSPDGRMLASGSDDGTVLLWDVSSGKERSKLEGHSKGVWSVSFSPDGRMLASGSSDNTIRLWDVSSGKERAKLEGHSGSVWSVSFSPDGRMLASGSYDRTVRLWDVSSGKERSKLEVHSNGVLSVTFSPDGRTLASGSDDNTIRLWDVSSGKERAKLEGHSNGVLSVTFSPDGRTLASGSGDRTVRLWDVSSGKERAKLEGHSNGVLSVTFSPDGRMLASGSPDNTIRLWETSTGKFTGFYLAGNRDLWLSCKIGTGCLRHDDGSLLQKSDPVNGRLNPIPAPLPKKTPVLPPVIEIPREALEILDGVATSFSIKVRNDGSEVLYWLQLIQALDEDTPLQFYLPKTLIKLLPGETAEFNAQVSYASKYEAPEGGTYPLKLRLLYAYGSEDLPASISIPVTAHTPSLSWEGAGWDWGWNTSTLKIRLRNVGDQAFNNALFSARLNDSEKQFDEIQSKTIAPGEEIVLSIPLPQIPTLQTLVSLTARNSEGWPVHEWHFNDQPISPPWFLGVYALVIFVSMYYFLLYRHPLMLRISANSANLLTLTPTELRRANRLLRLTFRLAPVLREICVTVEELNAALHFQYFLPQERCACLMARWQAKFLSESEQDSTSGIFQLTLGDDFHLNLTDLTLCLPAASEGFATLTSRLTHSQTLENKTILILHPKEDIQRKLHILAKDSSNQWVAPLPKDVTDLLLNPDPRSVLVRLISAQISLGRISPYQPNQGVRKDLMFFGRAKLLAHVMNRELSNYFVVGGRQMGKSTLLKALERRYKDHPGIECHFISQCPKDIFDDPTSQRVLELDIPKSAKSAGLCSYLAAQSDKRFLFLLDEADEFVAAERDRDYSTLKLFRKLSEQGRAYFIMAGFWQLYQETHNYQSPIYNFGETLSISALEPEACRELATVPMERLRIGYADDATLSRLLDACGGRANLISTACNEMLQKLDLISRSLSLEAVNLALHEAYKKTLKDCWGDLGNDPKERRLARIVIYLTIRNNDFTTPKLFEQLHALNVQASLDTVARLLDRLTLAHVLTHQETRYTYAVPLFREQILASEDLDLLLPEALSDFQENANQGNTNRY